MPQHAHKATADDDDKCSNCGKTINSDEYTTHWTLCTDCFDADYARHLNAQRNRMERGRPGRRPPPRRGGSK